MEIVETKLYKLSEAAEYLGLPHSTLRYYARNGSVPARRIGAKQWYMSGAAIRKMLEASNGAGSHD